MKGLLKIRENSILVQMDTPSEASMVLPRSVHCVRETIFVCISVIASHSTEEVSHKLQCCIALNCLNCGARWISDRDGILQRAQSLLSTQCAMHKSPIILEEL